VAQELKSGKMELTLEDTSSKMPRSEKEDLSMLMEIFIRVILRDPKQTDMVDSSGSKEVAIKENLWMMWLMEKAS